MDSNGIEMLTPVTRHGRLRRRRPGSETSPDIQGSSPVIFGMATSTPTNYTRTKSKIKDVTQDMDRIRNFRIEDEEEDEFFPPSSQYHPRCDGQVYWNGEASPSVKREIQRKLHEADAKSPNYQKKRPKSKPPRKIGLVQSNSKLNTQIDPDPIKTSEILDSLKRFAEFSSKSSKSENKNVESKNDKVLEKVAEDDPFGDSEDDSFLIKCSQAVELEYDTKKNLPEPQASSVPTCKDNKPKDHQNPFDDGDDSFDLLLSQMPDKMLTESNAIKKFNSEGDNSRCDSKDTANRTHSSPSVGSGRKKPGADSGKRKCSKEQIEIKRQAALKRLAMKQRKSLK